jgi:hypothetical protein
MHDGAPEGLPVAGRPIDVAAGVHGWYAVIVKGKLFGFFPQRQDADRMAARLGGDAVGVVVRLVSLPSAGDHGTA